MTDREFLAWIHERLEYQHKENPGVDYMWKLRSIILNIPPNQTTTNDTLISNSKQLQSQLKTMTKVVEI